MVRRRGTGGPAVRATIMCAVLASLALMGCAKPKDTQDDNNNTPAYQGDSACGVPGSAVSGLLDTDRFAVGDTEGTLASPGVSSDGFRCEITVGDATAITVVIKVNDDKVLSTVEGVIDRSEVDFPVVGGQGRGAYDPAYDATDASFDAVWVCEQVVGEVYGNADGWDQAALRSIVEDAADTAGCASS